MIKQAPRTTNIMAKTKYNNSIQGKKTSKGIKNQLDQTRVQTTKRSRTNTESSKAKRIRSCGFKSLEFIDETSSSEPM